MGAKGSTRWNGHRPKPTVEDCCRLSASDLAHSGRIPDGPGSGSLYWHSVDLMDSCGFLYVSYTLNSITYTNSDRKTYYLMLASPFNQTIYLESLAPRVGGTRWYFRCYGKDGLRWCKRIESLYLLPGSRRFLCRS